MKRLRELKARLNDIPMDGFRQGLENGLGVKAEESIEKRLIGTVDQRLIREWARGWTNSYNK